MPEETLLQRVRRRLENNTLVVLLIIVAVIAGFIVDFIPKSLTTVEAFRNNRSPQQVTPGAGSGSGPGANADSLMEPATIIRKRPDPPATFSIPSGTPRDQTLRPRYPR